MGGAGRESPQGRLWQLSTDTGQVLPETGSDGDGALVAGVR